VTRQPVECREGRKLVALLDQLLYGDVHQVGRVVHREGGIGHRLRRQSPGVLSICPDSKVLSDMVPVALA